MEAIFRPANSAPFLAALLFAALALALHWSVIAIVGTRLPYIFFLMAIALTAFYSGRSLALCVVALGALSAYSQFAFYGTAGTSLPENATLLIYLLCGISLALMGDRFRRLHLETRAQVADLQNLHDLSTALAATQGFPEQMHLIVTRLAAMQGATHAVLALHEPEANALRMVASSGFRDVSLAQLTTSKCVAAHCGLLQIERHRVIVTDTEHESTGAPLRELARHEGFRSLQCTPLLTSDGEILGVLAVYFATAHVPTQRELHFADICARQAVIHIERERAATNEREADRRLQAVVDASAVPFNLMAPVRDESGAIIDFRWVYANARAASIFGREPDELVGKSIEAEFPGSWHEPGLFENYVAVAQRAEVREFEVHSSANGILGWFHVVASPLAGNVAVWFADVTDRKRQEMDLIEAGRRKDEFLATLAQELRNPLAPIRQAAIIASKSNVTEDQRKGLHEVIERQVQHMALLLEDLLDVSRITRGALRLRRQRVSLRTLVEAAIETSRSSIEAGELRLEVAFDHEDAVLNVDRLRMTQVISNLLNNAAQYTDAGDTVRLVAGIRGADLQVCVEDTGVGIAAPDLESIFEMSATHPRAEGGLGIALALTKGLVELHGGTIEARSPGPGQGSTFVVSIPAALDSLGESSAQTHGLIE